MDQLVVQFKYFYQDLVNFPVHDFDRIYADNVVFRDPIVKVKGAAELLSYVEPVCEQVSYGRFEYLDQIVDGNKAYIKWNANFRHRKFGDRTISLHGMSHIQFDEKIYFHENVYDPGVLIYEQFPLAGTVGRWLKRRLLPVKDSWGYR